MHPHSSSALHSAAAIKRVGALSLHRVVIVTRLGEGPWECSGTGPSLLEDLAKKWCDP